MTPHKRLPITPIIANGLALVCIVIAAAAPSDTAPVAAPARTVTVTPDVFTDIYPAVWFSPSTGEIIGLQEMTEVPPHPRFEVWIEPRDPEFAFLKVEGKALGFTMVGRGQAAFDNPPPVKNPKFRKDLAVNDDGELIGAVFSCRGQHGSCLIMITAFDREKQLIRFSWRLTP